MKSAIALALFAILATAYCHPNRQIQVILNELCVQHGDGYLVPDIADCSKFYECVGSAGTHFQLACPSGLVYNTNLKACDYPDSTRCSNIFDLQ
ncbi:chitin-binding domain protein cbd-1-like [Agrilus planipennis]|uniref:Chitin-binding domain protein cbd-1-like n=1 Tax=Agrilus planipennis TaxID=224129 RepID=A0A1W4XDB7_AGRPL|nr:chitin-binding domain protein cbd-1-like [Agrilus planipennis]